MCNIVYVCVRICSRPFYTFQSRNPCPGTNLYLKSKAKPQISATLLGRLETPVLPVL